MYKEYFGLTDEPFRMTPDTRYLFRSHRHEEAISSLMYGIGEKKGFIVITGEIGTGKTTLCRTLLNHLDPSTKTAVILNPSLSKSELLHAILDDLSIEVPDKNPTQKKLLDRLNAFLIEQAKVGGNVAVIIDEAQNLDADVLESIRMLSNLETEQEKLLQIILVGQPELNEILKLPKLEQLRQRIAVRYHITPLEKAEIPEYISHRLMIAGNQKCVQFREDAIEEIAAYTRGTPRLINVICDKCLLAAYACRTNVIDGHLARTAIADHEGPAFGVPHISPTRPIPQGRPSVATAQSIQWRPALAAALIIGGILAVGLLVRSGTSASNKAQQAAAPVRSVAVEAVQPAAAPAAPAEAPAAPEAPASSLDEVLRRWGVTPGAATPEAAGMVTIPIVSDLSTLARIDLPALIQTTTQQVALIEATPTSFVMIADDPARGPTRFSISRMSPEAAGVVQARVLLPANFAYPPNPLLDPRFPNLLESALLRMTPQAERFPYFMNETRFREAVARFQNLAGIPADGIVGPLTWAAVVSRAHTEFPHLMTSR